jgi:hypothetical protein
VHRSRISTLLIDAPHAEAAAAAAFWSGATGVRSWPVPGEEQFTHLDDPVPGLVTAVQSIGDDPARYHLDMETDDVAAETERLLALGAVEVGGWLECRTLRVPGGHLMCVIPVHSDPAEFAERSHAWG